MEAAVVERFKRGRDGLPVSLLVVGLLVASRLVAGVVY